MDVKIVKMVQVARYRWNLLSPTGIIMVEDLQLASKQAAIDWVKAYVSSHNDWDYVIITKELK